MTNKPSSPTSTWNLCALTVVVVVAGACSGGDSGDPASGGGGQGGSAGGTQTVQGGSGGGGGGAPMHEWEVVLEQLGGPFSLAVYDGKIYIDDVTDGTIKGFEESDGSSLWVAVDNVSVRSRTLVASPDGLAFANATGIWLAALASIPATPTALVDRTMDVTDLEFGGDTVYYADNQTNTIESVPLAGGSPTILAADIDDARGIAVDASHIYFSTYGLNDPLAGSKVYRCPLSGCGATPQVVAEDASMIAAHDILLSDSAFFVANALSVRRCPLTGCTGPGELLLQHDSLVFEGLGGSPRDLCAAAYGPLVTDCAPDACEATRRETELGTITQSLTTTNDYIYLVSSSGPGDGIVARRRYEP